MCDVCFWTQTVGPAALRTLLGLIQSNVLLLGAPHGKLQHIMWPNYSRNGHIDQHTTPSEDLIHDLLTRVSTTETKVKCVPNKIMWKFLGSSSCLTSDLRPTFNSTQKGFHSQTHRHIRDLVTSYCKNRHNHELASQETFICLTVCWWHRTWAEPQNNLTKHQQQQHVAKLTIQSSYLTQYQRCWNVCSCVSLNHSSRILLNWFSIEPAAMHSGIDLSVKDTSNAF